MTWDDFARAINGRTHGELDEIHQYLAKRLAASHIHHGGSHVVRAVAFDSDNVLLDLQMCMWLCGVMEELSLLFHLSIIYNIRYL